MFSFSKSSSVRVAIFSEPAGICAVLLSLTVVMSGCNRDAADNKKETPLPRVAMITSSQDQDLDIGIKNPLKGHQTLNQTKYDLDVHEPDPAGAVGDQVKLIEELSADDIAALLIVPAGDGRELVPQLKEAEGKGIKVVVIGRSLNAEAMKEHDWSPSFVGTNGKQAALELAEELNRLALNSDKVIIVGQGSPEDFTEKQEGFEQGLSEGSLQIAIVEQLTTEGSEGAIKAGQKRVRDLLKKHKDVSAILCTDYATTMGAINARDKIVDEDDERKIAVFGFGNGRNYNNLIEKGVEMVAVVQYNQMAVQSIGIFFSAEAGDEPTTLEVPVDLARGSDLSTKFPEKTSEE